jgi:hypothetical protein
MDTSGHIVPHTLDQGREHHACGSDRNGHPTDHMDGLGKNVPYDHPNDHGKDATLYNFMSFCIPDRQFIEQRGKGKYGNTSDECYQSVTLCTLIRNKEEPWLYNKVEG